MAPAPEEALSAIDLRFFLWDDWHGFGLRYTIAKTDLRYRSTIMARYNLPYFRVSMTCLSQ